METVHILLKVNCLQNLLLVEVFGQRQLDKNPVHGRISIQITNDFLDLFLRNISRQRVMEGFVMSTFRNLLFQRVIPNLKRIGLMTDSVRPKFEELGILDFESLPDDGDIDWKALERPLDVSEEQSVEQKVMQEQMEKILNPGMQAAG